MDKRTFDLEDRLVSFACTCLTVCDKLPNTKAGLNLEHQLSKSGTSCALNYGEAQAAESPADFIHKLKLVLKELRETRVTLKIIQEKPLLQDPVVPAALDECNQLMAIFMKSINTAKANKGPSKTA
ncbi:MAG: four helix bundle protein [Chitinophagaceae bacterium]|nr:four helix bundle protein [Chitinophagaceae bacterium]